MSKWFPLLGLGFAVAGADKLLGLRAYDRLFARFGWSEPARQLIGSGEFIGGVLVASNSMRHLGGTLLTAVSTAMLTAEVGRHERDLALPRCMLLVAAASALLPVRRHSHQQPIARKAHRDDRPTGPAKTLWPPARVFSSTH